MNKKSIQIKETESTQPHEISRPQWSDEQTVKTITELADFYGIEYKLKINKNMNHEQRESLVQHFQTIESNFDVYSES